MEASTPHGPPCDEREGGREGGGGEGGRKGGMFISYIINIFVVRIKEKQIHTRTCMHVP